MNGFFSRKKKEQVDEVNKPLENTKSSNIMVFGLSNSLPLAEKIVNHLGIELSPMRIEKFADGEIIVAPKVPVRGRDVVLIQSTSKPVNDSLMELLIAIDACKRASARKIAVVIPYYGYARQDRKAKAREPITGRLVAKMIESAGATVVLTWDIHSLQTQGFFDIPFDSLEAVWIIMSKYMDDFRGNPDNITIVSPDYGCVKRAREIALALECNLAIVDKRRSGNNQVEINNVLGDVANKDCVIVDDMIDTGGTILGAAKIVKEKGAKSITIIATHGLFNKNAKENFKQSIEQKIVDKVYISDTIQTTPFEGLEIVSVSEAIAKCIDIYSIGKGSMSFVHDENSEQILIKKRNNYGSK